MPDFDFSNVVVENPDFQYTWTACPISFTIEIDKDVKKVIRCDGESAEVILQEDGPVFLALSIKTVEEIKEKVDSILSFFPGAKFNRDLRILCYGEVENVVTQVRDASRLVTTTGDPRVPTLGWSEEIALVYAARHHKGFPKFKDWRKKRSTRRVNEVISFYLNCYLACVPQVLYPKKKLSGLILTDTIRGYNPSDEEIGEADTTPMPLADLTICAFFGICSLTKKAYSFASTAEDQKIVENMRKWVEKRVKAVAVKCNVLSEETKDYSYDLLIVSKYLEDKLDIRALYYPLLVKATGEGAGGTWPSFRSYAQLILAETGMQSFLIAKAFSEANETQAHLLNAVCEESDKIDATWLKVKEEAKSGGFSERFYFVLKGLLPEMETRNFPNLLYCAIYQLKAAKEADSNSWSNYVARIPTTINPATLRQNTDALLLSTGAGEGVSEIANRCLGIWHWRCAHPKD